MTNETQTVPMEDGRVVEFAGKRKILKSSEETSEGKVKVTIDFRNGATRSIIIPDALLKKSAAHGMEQKLGDAAAGLTDIDDAVMAIEGVIAQLEQGEWSAQRKGTGMAGASILLQALVKYYDKPVDDVRAWLKTKSQEEKLALRRNSHIAPIIAEIEAAKGAKESAVDSNELLAELEA